MLITSEGVHTNKVSHTPDKTCSATVTYIAPPIPTMTTHRFIPESNCNTENQVLV